MIGSGWYRQLLFVVLGIVVFVAAVAAALGGADGVLRVGLVVSALGLVGLVVYASPWFDQEWPLDGKDGWLIAGSLLTPVGIIVVATGLLL